LWFTLGISVLTGVLAGLAPALGSSRRKLADSLRERVGSVNRRFGRVLIVAEVAGVLVLLIGAGLVLRSLITLSHVEPGFRPSRAVAWQLFLPRTKYTDAAAQRAFYRNMVEQVSALPGVESAGLAQPLPFGPISLVSDTGFDIAGRPLSAPGMKPQALITRANTTYFSAMGIPLRRGRVFTDQDTDKVVISESLARRHFQGEDPVGQRLLLGSRRLEVEIIGVVGDVKHNTLANDIRPEFYLQIGQFTTGAVGLVVRTRGDAAAAIPALQQRVWSLEPGMAANLAMPIEAILYSSLAPARIATLLLGAFAAITLILGLVGVYGVLSYSVRQRTREIGIRLALGASRSEVLQMVLREALLLSAIGVAFGLAATPFLARSMSTLLYGIKSTDALTYAVAIVSVPVAALLAAYLPALRATRVDPASSLRSE
jgi:predicted permease